MTKASDNAFPSILVTEGTEPSAPAAGKQRLYIDSTTHHLMRTNSSGTETDIEGGGGIAATIFSAKGEVLGASANDTPALIAAAAGNNDSLGANSSLTPGAGFLRHRFCAKTADETKSSTAFADSTNMVFAIEASKTYKGEWVIFYDTNATTVGIKLGMSGPTNCTAYTCTWVTIGAPAGGGNTIYSLYGPLSTNIATDLTIASPTSGPGPISSGVAGMAVIKFWLVNSTNAGNIQLRHASETNTATTIYTGSHGEIWEVV